MENTFVRKALLAVVLAYATCAQAQWLNHPDPRIPRTRDGKPNLMAPTPRASNGKPDLSGVWQAYASEPGEMLRLLQGPAPRSVNQIDPGIDLQTFSKYFLNVLADFKPGEEPMRPEAAALLKQRGQSQGKDVPTSHCLPGGVPFSTLVAPFKMIQAPMEIVMILEDTNPPRQILSPCGWDIRPASGTATRWSWIAWALTTEPGLTHLVILIVNPCTSPSASGERTSVIWISK
ncbi:MAG: hypothetical protein DMG19_18570 [Acidobacteria bacterium]|nr:MAG: hypothetical protein DMG19_18570 [Acidobacteriota bacterium]